MMSSSRWINGRILAWNIQMPPPSMLRPRLSRMPPVPCSSPQSQLQLLSSRQPSALSLRSRCLPSSADCWSYLITSWMFSWCSRPFACTTVTSRHRQMDVRTAASPSWDAARKRATMMTTMPRPTNDHRSFVAHSCRTSTSPRSCDGYSCSRVWQHSASPRTSHQRWNFQPRPMFASWTRATNLKPTTFGDRRPCTISSTDLEAAQPTLFGESIRPIQAITTTPTNGPHSNWIPASTHPRRRHRSTFLDSATPCSQRTSPTSQTRSTNAPSTSSMSGWLIRADQTRQLPHTQRIAMAPQVCQWHLTNSMPASRPGRCILLTTTSSSATARSRSSSSHSDPGSDMTTRTTCSMTNGTRSKTG
mmetsp:Transcript_5009/g.13311  ORF Transcript_5009/g.13311 Transcript_5009/m.13311 type:complete len:361 (-) Transcript_5009:834-1916(-)